MYFAVVKSVKQVKVGKQQWEWGVPPRLWRNESSCDLERLCFSSFGMSILDPFSIFLWASLHTLLKTGTNMGKQAKTERLWNMERKKKYKENLNYDFLKSNVDLVVDESFIFQDDLWTQMTNKTQITIFQHFRHERELWNRAKIPEESWVLAIFLNSGWSTACLKDGTITETRLWFIMLSTLGQPLE